MKRWYGVVLVLVLLLVSVLPAAAQGEQDIVDTAVGAGNFTTLAAALEAAGLVETLKGEGPFTVFAPTDEAFNKLPPGLLDSLLQDTEALTAILTYHVVPGEVLAADVVGLNGQSVETVQGEAITVTVNGSAVMVNDSNVTATDVQASNGVIHVIDAVLIPPSIAASLSAPSAEGQATPQAAPQTMPTTGAADGDSTLPIVAMVAGLLLLGGAAVLRLRPQSR
jgi:transforming growth factor-beta-induced protein